MKFQELLNSLKENSNITWNFFEDFFYWKIFFHFRTEKCINFNSDKNSFGKKEISISLKRKNEKLFLMRKTIHKNFLESMKSFKIPNNVIYMLIDVLQKEINFYKIQKNDLFTLITSKDHFDKEKPNFFAIKLKTQKKNFYVFCFKKESFLLNSSNVLIRNLFYSAIRKEVRISSRFNLHRLNPVTKTIIPHKGVDLAVPIGTPVLAAEDGKIIIAKKDITAGNYVAIQHKFHSVTRYMHLKKYFVRVGQDIKKGECIALSGNTGRSIGPHLHFEIWINKKAIDPLIHYKKFFYQDQRKIFFYIKKLMFHL